MILITYGTRPEWIKVSPLIEEMKKQGLKYKTLFTGQHKDLAPKDSDFTHEMVELNSNRLNSILNNCLNISDEVFEGVDYVLVQGDTSSGLGLALSAFHRKIKIIHLEAGLRTYDYNNPYPEEMNRQLISKLTDIHFCPTFPNRENLISEGINDDKIFVVGNTGLDNLLVLKDDCKYNDKILITLHRRENHDKISEWFKNINDLAKTYPNLEFILPIHPNPNVVIYKELLTNVNVIEPLQHDELIRLLIECKLVISDSGGIQEECSFFNKKCIVCREVTERSEANNLTNFLVKNPDNLKVVFDSLINNYESNFISPFGDGKASKKICKILKKILNGEE